MLSSCATSPPLRLLAGLTPLLLAFATGCGDAAEPPLDDRAPPTVLSNFPSSDATGVATSAGVSATFSEAMDLSTLTTSSFVLMRDSVRVAGSVNRSDRAVSFRPSRALLANTKYVATLTTAAQDTSGNALAADYTWSFTTGSSADATAPTVVATRPEDGASAVAFGTSIAVTFSETMDPVTLTNASFTVKQGSKPIAGVVSYAGVTATMRPTSALRPSTHYSVTITTAAADLTGNPLAAGHDWTFTTASDVDTSPPEIRAVYPLQAAVAVPINRSVTALFSEAMHPPSVNAATFRLEGPGATAVAGEVTLSAQDSLATFSPLDELTPNTAYEATVTTTAQDVAGNALAHAFSWTFTTGAHGALGPEPVLLGGAGGFVILAKSGIDSVPTSVITGDIGVSPIDQTAITGFSVSADASNTFATSAQVTGRIYAADNASPTPADLTAAVSDLETAYVDAAGRSTPDHTELGSGELGGLTLAPGLYKWGTGVSIATDLSLDGGAQDVWVFQISGDITQAANTRVTLSGGALARNVFWQSFGQIVIGTGAHFEGIALCETAIILRAGASVNGRLLAQTAVTLDQSTVTEPAE